MKVTDSSTPLSGLAGLSDKQLFREYDRFNENNFYMYLKEIHWKFTKCYLFIDKRPTLQITKSQTLFEQHKDVLIPVWLPTASPEFMVLEEY